MEYRIIIPPKGVIFSDFMLTYAIVRYSLSEFLAVLR